MSWAATEPAELAEVVPLASVTLSTPAVPERQEWLTATGAVADRALERAQVEQTEQVPLVVQHRAAAVMAAMAKHSRLAQPAVWHREGVAVEPTPLMVKGRGERQEELY